MKYKVPFCATLIFSMHVCAKNPLKIGVDASYLLTYPTASGEYANGSGSNKAQYEIAFLLKRNLTPSVDLQGSMGYSQEAFVLTSNPVDNKFVDEYYDAGKVKERESIYEYENSSLNIGSELSGHLDWLIVSGGLGFSVPLSSENSKQTRYHYAFGRDTIIVKPSGSGNSNASIYSEFGTGISFTQNFNIFVKYKIGLSDVVEDAKLNQLKFGISWCFGSVNLKKESSKVDTNTIIEKTQNIESK